MIIISQIVQKPHAQHGVFEQSVKRSLPLANFFLYIYILGLETSDYLKNPLLPGHSLLLQLEELLHLH